MENINSKLNEDTADVVASLYKGLSPHAQAGVLIGAQPAVQAAILSLYEGVPIPEVLLEAAMSEGVGNPEVIWVLACRQDLPQRVVQWLIKHGSLRDWRMVAGMPQVREEEARALLPGDGKICSDLLLNPHLSSELKRHIVLEAKGTMLSRTMRGILAGWQFTTWAAESPDAEVRAVAFGNLTKIPLYWRWTLAKNLCKTPIPFKELCRKDGWGQTIRQILMRGAKAEELNLGSRAQIGFSVHQELEKIGAPPITALEEARMLLAQDDARILNTKNPNDLPWEELTELVATEKASPAAVLLLLSLEGHSDEFAAWAVANYSKYRSIMLSCTEDEVRGALHQFWDDGVKRRTIIRRMAVSLGMDGIRKFYPDFKASDLTWMIKRSTEPGEGVLRRACGVIMDEVSILLEDDPIAWGNFEALRNSNPVLSLNSLCGKVLSIAASD